MDWKRAMRHMTVPLRGAKTLFDHAALLRLQSGIEQGEATHRGEVRLIVESALPFRKIRRNMTPRQRALDLFGTFRVWDTEENNGVLLYVNACDRALEVIADRAASRLVGEQQWLFALGLAQDELRKGRFEEGIAIALETIREGLAAAFPASDAPSRKPAPAGEAPLRPTR